MNIILPAFSQRLKALRKENHLTQRQMAELLACTERHYQKIEYGEVNLPTLDLMLLADYFKVSTDYLLGRTDQREAKGL